MRHQNLKKINLFHPQGISLFFSFLLLVVLLSKTTLALAQEQIPEELSEQNLQEYQVQNQVQNPELQIEVKKELPLFLQQQWGNKDESKIKKSYMFLPRLILRPMRNLLSGKTIQRIINLGHGGKHQILYLAKKIQMKKIHKNILSKYPPLTEIKAQKLLLKKKLADLSNSQSLPLEVKKMMELGGELGRLAVEKRNCLKEDQDYLKYKQLKEQAKNKLVHVGDSFGDSVLNVLGTLGHVLSDTALIMKSLFYAPFKTTDRIQLCTMNLATNSKHLLDANYEDDENPSISLALLHLINPADHVAVMIDDGETHNFQLFFDFAMSSDKYTPINKEKMQCTPVPIFSNEPESIAIARLRCIGQKYRPDYSPITYNCGYYARDVLAAAGMGFPGMPNFGVGNELGKAGKHRKAELKKAMLECDQYIINIRRLLFALEKGDKLDGPLQVVLAEINNASLDVQLQVVISAARAGNEENRKLLLQKVKDLASKLNFYRNPENYEINRRYKKLLLSMMQNLQAEHLAWLKLYYPSVSHLYHQMFDVEQSNESDKSEDSSSYEF